jgi:large subunit ribosomal protein L9
MRLKQLEQVFLSTFSMKSHHFFRIFLVALSLIVTKCFQFSFSPDYSAISRRRMIRKSLVQLQGLRSSTGSTGNKVRVRLLQDMPDLGKKGEIILVSMEQFTNFLLVKRAAERITDEQLAKIQADIALKQQQEIEFATQTGQLISNPNTFLKFSRKVGANQQIFGSITTKTLYEEIKKKYPDRNTLWNLKNVGVVDIIESTNNQVVDDIRKIGEFIVRVKLHPNVPLATVKVIVVAEK